jgi:hypothetical protein
MRRWPPLLLSGLLSLVAVTSPVFSQGGGRVLQDSTVVVFPGPGSNQCVQMQAGTLIVDVQRTGDMGGGAYPVAFSLQPFVVARPLLDLTIGDTPTSTSVPVQSGPYCYGLTHPGPWTDRPESAPRGQLVALRLTLIH